MNTCKTCKYWDRAESYIDPRHVVKRCKKFVAFYLTDADGVYSDDGNINTGPDFGCIHHEPQEITNAT